MKHLPRPALVVRIFGSLLLAVVGSLIVTTPGNAVPIPGTGGRHLSLEADSYPAQWNEMSPGDSVDWQFWTVLSGQPDATLSVQITSSGDLAENSDGLRMLLRQCPIPWTESPAPTEPALCAGTPGSTVVDSPMASISPTTVYPLGEIRQGSGPYFLATLSIPAIMTLTQQQSMQGWEGNFALGLTAAGETATLGSDGGLAFTGADPTGFMLGGTGLLLGGLAFAATGSWLDRFRFSRLRLHRLRGRRSS